MTNSAGEDRGESVIAMEPMLISGPRRDGLADLALDLTARSTGLRRSLPAGISTAMADLVRSMNCYYSNLIEGHDTHPVDIENALNDDYSEDPKQRDLQLEAKAHITVQQWIDGGGVLGRATTRAGIIDIHRRFCELLPPDMLWVDNRESKEPIEIIPGELRTRDVKVGRHVPVSPGALPRFLKRFETAYSGMGKFDQIVASGAAHHRLLWLHPFLDGNGRVARLMSYAMLLESLDTGGTWSVARGLARDEAQYKQHLVNCDLPRRNDLDGRGQLSEEALAEFVDYFLTTCIDQVAFMETLIEPDRMRDRILVWAEEQMKAGVLPIRSGAVIEAVLFRGELARSDVTNLLGISERSARRITSALIECGVLVTASSRAPLRLAFPARYAARWLPGLFPDK